MKNIFLFILIFTTAITSCRSQTNPVLSDKTNIGSLQKQLRDALPDATGVVNDFEDLFTLAEEKILDSLITAFEKETTIEFAVLTIDSTMASPQNLDEFTLHVANKWGVGKKDKNNGVTIGISKAYKRMRIQNGYGIEKILSDVETKEIIDSSFIPHYKADNYFEGTRLGLTAMMDALRKKTTTKK